MTKLMFQSQILSFTASEIWNCPNPFDVGLLLPNENILIKTLCDTPLSREQPVNS